MVYARRLDLRAGPGAAGGEIVMAGIMRIDLEYCSERVREEIIAGETPLGRILIEHEVLRWIEPHAYFRVALDPTLSRLFELDPESAAETYGRVARIFCDGEPAVELLEVVSPKELESP